MHAGFVLARELGYDGVELMVWSSGGQDVEAVSRLADASGIPVLAVHAPCSRSPSGCGPRTVERLRRAACGHGSVRGRWSSPAVPWQRRCAAVFDDEVRRAEEHAGIAVAVENMFPIVRGAVRAVPTARASVDRRRLPELHAGPVHTAAAGTDALALWSGWVAGSRTSTADGSGARDSTSCPGAGSAMRAGLRALAASGFTGAVVLEINTGAPAPGRPGGALAEALLFAAPAPARSGAATPILG